MKANLTFFLIVLFSGCALNLRSQEAVIRVIDARTNQTIPFAHIQFESKDNKERYTAATTFEGTVVNRVKSRSSIQITYVGYRTFTDTISPGQNMTVKLQPEVYNMDEIVVTGQYTPQPIDKSIFRIKVIGSRQIERKASANLGELMAGELNIRTSHDGALGSKITLQGLGGEHIKFLIDGVPVIGRMNGNIDLGQLNLYNVAHIEVIEGPMSVIYGSNALAGVINVITKENRHNRISAQAASYLESVGVYNFNADVALRKNNWSASIAGARNFFGGYSPVDTSRSKRWKPKRQYNADASIGYQHQATRARFTASYFNEMLLDKGNLRKPYFENAFDSHFNSNRLTTKLDLNTPIFRDRFLNLLTSFSHYDRRKNTYFNDLTKLDKSLTKNLSDHDTSSFGQYLLRAEFSKSTEKSPFNYQLGIDLNYEDGTGKRVLNKKQAMGDYATFVSFKIKPGARWMLQPGLRFSYNTKYKAPLVYSLNTKWDISEPLALRVSYAKGFRAPSIKELYLEFVDINHNIRGNENLKAEDSQNINMSLKYQQEKPTYDYGVEFNLFYNNIRNSITLAIVDPEEALYTYVNLNNMITQGFQLNFNNRLYPWLEIKAGLGQTGRKQVMDTDDRSTFIYTSDILGTINYLWRRTDVGFDLYYKYNGDYPEVFLNSDGQLLRSVIQGYHTLDFSVSKRFWNNRLNLQIGAKNLFNNTNIAIKGDAGSGGIHSGGMGSSAVGWGRTYFVKLNLLFQQF
jgi:outer membrane receptor for ferrienterochelin and colicins